MSMIMHYTKLHLRTTAVDSIIQNANFNFQLPTRYVISVSLRSDIIKNLSSSEDLPAQKISWSHVDCYKFCIRLRSLNVDHFEMVEAA
jgi:DNA polymerase III sliding clamp (beta) subunit (PCNA family)